MVSQSIQPFFSAPRQAPPADEQVARRVSAFLFITAGDVARQIDSEVERGQVRLRGTVATTAKKLQVEALCRRVAGVHGVLNLLRVVPRSEANPDPATQTVPRPTKRRSARTLVPASVAVTAPERN